VHSYYALLALDLANDRVQAAEHERLASLARSGRPARPTIVRRGLAHGTAAISRTAAAATRRLDDCVADDLGRSLALAD
jgi:hypothetical protein